jgi:hypothetical protein
MTHKSRTLIMRIIQAREIAAAAPYQMLSRNIAATASNANDSTARVPGKNIRTDARAITHLCYF